MKKVVFWQKNNSKGDQAANLPDDISQSEAKLIILCKMAVFPNCTKTQILLHFFTTSGICKEFLHI